MGAADAAGREETDAGLLREKHGGGDRGRGGLPLRDGDGQVAATGFQDVLAVGGFLELGVAQADRGPAMEDGDGGRHGTGVAHRLFRRLGRFEVSNTSFFSRGCPLLVQFGLAQKKLRLQLIQEWQILIYS